MIKKSPKAIHFLRRVGQLAAGAGAAFGERRHLFFAGDARVDAISLPETVRGALRRNLDRIDPGSQLSLKVVSVVGNRFASMVVRSIYPIEAERKSVSAYLKDAKLAGFISDMLVDKLDGYHFNSATIADVAYEMTLNEQRRLLHRETAEWYESHFKEIHLSFLCAACASLVQSR